MKRREGMDVTSFLLSDCQLRVRDAHYPTLPITEEAFAREEAKLDDALEKKYGLSRSKILEAREMLR